MRPHVQVVHVPINLRNSFYPSFYLTKVTQSRNFDTGQMLNHNPCQNRQSLQVTESYCQNIYSISSALKASNGFTFSKQKITFFG